jgi:hypothetical protein
MSPARWQRWTARRPRHNGDPAPNPAPGPGERGCVHGGWPALRVELSRPTMYSSDCCQRRRRRDQGCSRAGPARHAYVNAASPADQVRDPAAAGAGQRARQSLGEGGHHRQPARGAARERRAGRPGRHPDLPGGRARRAAVQLHAWHAVHSGTMARTGHDRRAGRTCCASPAPARHYQELRKAAENFCATHCMIVTGFPLHEAVA